MGLYFTVAEEILKLRKAFFGRLAEAQGTKATAMGVTVLLADEKEAAAPTELLRPGRRAPRVLQEKMATPIAIGRGCAAGIVGCGCVKYRHERDYRHNVLKGIAL